MPKWQFWKNESDAESAVAPPVAPAVASRARGFTPPPPRSASGLAGSSESADPALTRLIHRHEMLQREIEQAETAGTPDNPWAERADLIDQAIASVVAALRKPVERVDVPVPPLPGIPIAVKVLRAEAPSSVRVILEGHQLDFAEEVDWAERGTSIVRGDLQLKNGGLSDLTTALQLDANAAAKFEMSLFSLATDARDRALENNPNLSDVLICELLPTCSVCGDLALWNGVCLSCEQRNAARLSLEEERKRLFEERDSILKDRATVIERLPMLRKRFAETATAIETARSDSTVDPNRNE